MTIGNPSEDDMSYLPPLEERQESPRPDQAPNRPRPASYQFYYHQPPNQQQPWYGQVHLQSHYFAPNVGFTGSYAAPATPNYAGQPFGGAPPMPPPPLPTIAPLGPQWTFPSCVAYEVLRSIGYPVNLSRCIAGTWSNIRPYKGFNKGEWNEAVRRLNEHYHMWMKGQKLQEFYWLLRRQREGDEKRKDEKDRHERELAEKSAGMGQEAQDTRPWSPAGPSHQAEEVEAAAPQADVAEAPEPLAEEEATDPPHQEHQSSHQRDSLSEGSEGSQPDEKAEQMPRVLFPWASPRIPRK